MGRRARAGGRLERHINGGLYMHMNEERKKCACEREKEGRPSLLTTIEMIREADHRAGTEYSQWQGLAEDLFVTAGGSG